MLLPTLPTQRVWTEGKDCHQVHGVQYGEIYAPVVHFTSVLAVLTTEAVQDLEVQQMDIVTSFLHRVLERNIYMELPAFFKDPSQSDFM